MYVTRKKLNSAIENFSKQMEGLTSNIAVSSLLLSAVLLFDQVYSPLLILGLCHFVSGNKETVELKT